MNWNNIKSAGKWIGVVMATIVAARVDSGISKIETAIQDVPQLKEQVAQCVIDIKASQNVGNSHTATIAGISQNLIDLSGSMVDFKADMANVNDKLNDIFVILDLKKIKTSMK